jgi:hypothetical protein
MHCCCAMRTVARCPKMLESPPFVRGHMATFAVDILARRPALLEIPTAFSLTAVLFAVLDVLRPLLPFMCVSTRRVQHGLAPFRFPRLPLFRFVRLFCLASSAAAGSTCCKWNACCVTATTTVRGSGGGTCHLAITTSRWHYLPCCDRCWR